MQTPFGARLGTYALAPRAPAAIATPRRDIGYPELAGRVGRCAAWLVRAGCRPEEVVGISVADEVAHLIACLALLTLGVPQVCLATSAPAAMRRQLAERLGVRTVVVADPADAPAGCTALALPPELFAGANGDRLPALAADPDAPAIYFTSSGTTGAPKIFAMSQRAMVWRATHILASEDARPGYRAYAPASIEQAPANSKRYNCVCLGHTSVFDDAGAAQTQTLPAFCARMGVTSVELSGLQAAGLLHDAAAGRFAPGTQVHVSGMRTPAPLRRAFRERFGVPLSIHYGAREFGRITSTYPDPVDDEYDSVGAPVPWIELELVDDDGRPVAPGAIGEVRARAECMTHAYYRDPQATAHHVRAGWFHPGDLASLTPAGTLRLHGRTDDMMNLNGIKIFPAEIERVLEAHAAVRAAVAFARPSPAHGDIPLAAIELHAGAVVDVDGLLAAARSALGVRAPRRIIVVERLPRNAAGKVLRRELAAQVLREGQRQPEPT